MKDWDLPLLNQPKSNRLLTNDLLVAEQRKIVENALAFEQLRRLRDLRESCGVKSESTSTVNVRIPHRYLKP